MRRWGGCLMRWATREARGVEASGLTTQRARRPAVSVIDLRGGKRIGDALEGATRWWVSGSALATCQNDSCTKSPKVARNVGVLRDYSCKAARSGLARKVCF